MGRNVGMLAASIAFLAAIGAVAAADPVLGQLEQAIRGKAAEPAIVAPAAPAAQPTGEKAPAEPGYLGAMADDQHDRGRGVRVVDVRPDGPAAKAGLQKGDLITGLAGVRVRQMSDMADIMALLPPGETIALDLTRGEKPQQIKVTLGRRPAAAGAAAVPPPVPAPPPPLLLPAEPGPILAPPKPEPADPQARIAELQRRIEQLEARVAELEKALAASLKKR